jgi:hypothetical protein
MRIFIQEKDSGILLTNKNEDYFFDQILYELVTANPEKII